MLQDFVQQQHHAKYPSSLLLPQPPQGIFIAVNRGGMEVNTTQDHKYKSFVDENLQTLNRVVAGGNSNDDGGSGLLQGNNNNSLTVFECGRQWTDRYYEQHPNSIRYGGLLDSVLNFYISTEAPVFVGVRGSSYSTDIWTTRYHQGKGQFNYEYTPDGIKPIPNGGLPPPHGNCRKK
jgi:hypothetical protein